MPSASAGSGGSRWSWPSSSSSAGSSTSEWGSRPRRSARAGWPRSARGGRGLPVRLPHRHGHDRGRRAGLGGACVHGRATRGRKRLRDADPALRRWRSSARRSRARRTSSCGLLDRFGLIATYSWSLELARVALIVGAIQFFDSLMAVVVAVVIATLAAGVVNAIVAARVFRSAHGLSLARSQLGDVRPRGTPSRCSGRCPTPSLSRTAGSCRRSFRRLLLGAIAGATQTGIYKVGMAAATVVGKLIDPASAALLPRLSRLWSAGRLQRTASADLPGLPHLGSGHVPGVRGGCRLPGSRSFASSAAARPARRRARCCVLGAATQALYGLVFWHSTLLFAADRTGPDVAGQRRRP